MIGDKMKYIILYNSLSDNKKGLDKAKEIECKFNKEDEVEYVDFFQIEDSVSYIKNLPSEVVPVICGGDGSINHFVTELDDEYISRDIFYFPCGSGNDFARDVIGSEARELIKLNEYITNLPKITVKGKKYRYINDAGFGVDGYVCEEADRLRQNTNKSINYALIALKGLLFKFKGKTATVEIDGKSYTFNKAWIASTFNGRYYGGGMQIVPEQDRLSEDNMQTFVCLHGCGKLKALIIFSGVFSLRHLKYTKNVTFIKGKDIAVSFDSPSPIQLDGEVISGVTSYKVQA